MSLCLIAIWEKTQAILDHLEFLGHEPLNNIFLYEDNFTAPLPLPFPQIPEL